ncbi:prepilin-type N-terminal cleavage/methylation domain-containing protein [Maridesulfovibrio sp.]|uniref:PulJ/GspJ family protein n=1 Tax=Maridesulfovibrio sp. TaxID=2795000 RepID=UPI0029F50773|nr:prepilin-type N-terminal cleavage/methylation domain-containing protein [Maridesulfovibrio sp.]
MVGPSGNHITTDRQAGFSLIELLIGLVLSGLLMSMVAMVLGQSITNNEVVRSSSGLSTQMFTLRRILHRDLQNIVINRPISVEKTGLSFESNHCILLEGIGAVSVFWDFSSNMIRRTENSNSLGYGNTYMLMRGLDSWTVEFLGNNNVWVSRSQQSNRAVRGHSGVKAIRLKLRFDDGQDVMIVERIPYATE